MDSADGVGRQNVIDNMVAAGVPAEFAQNRLMSWYDSASLEARHYQEQYNGMLGHVAELSATNHDLQEVNRQIIRQKELLEQRISDDEELRIKLLRDFASTCALGIPFDALDTLATAKHVDDLAGLKNLLDSATGIQAQTLPIGNKQEPVFLNNPWRKSEPGYGSIESAPDFDMYGSP